MSRFFSRIKSPDVPSLSRGGTGWGWVATAFTVLLLLATIALAELAPAPLDLTISSGETYTLTRRLRAAGRIADLTGYQVRAQLRANYADTAPLASFDSVPLDSTGMVRLTLTQQQTVALNMKTGYWDLLLIAPDGSQQYILRGKFRCVPSATRYP